MSLLERRRAMMQLGMGDKGGFLDGKFAQLTAGSDNYAPSYISYDSGRSFLTPGSTGFLAQTELVPDFLCCHPTTRVQWNSASNSNIGPIYVNVPSGSTGGAFSKLILRSYRPNGTINDLAVIKIRVSGSSRVVPENNNAQYRAYDAWVGPGANNIVAICGGWLVKMETKRWLDETYPGHGCECFAEWLVNRRLNNGGGAFWETCSMCYGESTNYTNMVIDDGTRINYICGTTYNTMVGAPVKSQFSTDDSMSFGIVQTSTLVNSQTPSLRAHLITRTGGTSWSLLRQVLPTSQSMGPVNYTASSFVMSDDGKTAVLFTQGGAAISKDYLNSFEWVPYTSMSFATSMSMYAWGAAGSNNLKTIYILDHNGNVFISKNLCKSWKLVYQQPGNNSFAAGVGLTDQDMLRCSSDGATCVRIWPGPASAYTASTIVFSDYGASYEVVHHANTFNFPRQFTVWRNSGKYDHIWKQDYLDMQSCKAISASLRAFFFEQKGKTATVFLESGETINMPAVMKDSRYSESWSYATGSAGTNFSIAMAPQNNSTYPTAWGGSIESPGQSVVSLNMSNLDAISELLYFSGSVKSIELN
jgi:hypothetical protein